MLHHIGWRDVAARIDAVGCQRAVRLFRRREAIMICAPGLIQALSPAAKATIGVSFSMSNFYSPSLYFTITSWPFTLVTAFVLKRRIFVLLILACRRAMAKMSSAVPASGRDVPTIVLSARTRNREDRSVYLGADDYVNKPFNVGELLVRTAHGDKPGGDFYERCNFADPRLYRICCDIILAKQEASAGISMACIQKIYIHTIRSSSWRPRSGQMNWREAHKSALDGGESPPVQVLAAWPASLLANMELMSLVFTRVRGVD